MKEEKFLLSDKEIRRATVIQKLIDGILTTTEAAEILSLSDRQIKRLKAGVIHNGLGSLAHGNRGRKPSHTISDELKEHILKLAQQEPYAKANNTHLSELLAEHEHISLSVSSVRRIRKSVGILSPRKHRPPKLHRRRPRKEREGMLIQIDATPHHWLEAGHPSVALVGAIDDATGKIVGAVFRPTEDLEGYFEMLRQILTDYGVPLAIYSDRHTIFRSSNEDKLTLEDELAGKKAPLTQFGRALNELGIEHIKARSPQAKGRIERLWQTLQDRLVVELALAGITSIEKANQFLRGFIAKFNVQFEVDPENSHSAFRTPPATSDLFNEYLCIKESRKAKGGVISYQGNSYQIVFHDKKVDFHDKSIIVHELFDGRLKACNPSQRGTLYDLKLIPKPTRSKPNVEYAKEKAGPRLPRRPASNHPWRKPFKSPQDNYNPGQLKFPVNQ